MAQDTFRPVRSDDPYPRDPAPTNPGRSNDPLAELARLIGKEDPFADLRRPAAQTAAQAPGAQAPGAQAPSAQAPAAQAPAPSRPPAAPYADQHESAPEWLGRRDPEPGAEPYDPRYEQPSGAEPHQHYESGYDAAQYEQDPRYAEAAYATDDQQAYASQAYYEDGQAYGEEGYDEAPPAKRRGLMTILAVVLGLAVLGSGGYFGYRAWTSPSSGGGEPPVIKAEQAPTKVAPAPPASDNQPAKAYDRVGDRGGEKVVPREEQPVDPRSALRAQPGAATSAGGTAGSTASVLPPLPSTQPIPAAAGEPKKVKTITIRDATAAAAPAIPPAIPPVSPPVSQPPRAAAPPPPTRTVAAETGGYVVQVASQRSEADAQASFKVLQQKYPSVLGGHQAMIRRADLGEKGIFFRAQVGPFASAEQATEVCNNLKSAGGQCVVQRN